MTCISDQPYLTRTCELPGLLHVPEFITATEEGQLDSFFSTQTHWDWLGKKRRLPFGFTYSPSKRKIVRPAPPIPPILHALAVRFNEVGMMKKVANQVVVQEYLTGQGIGRHTDSGDFGPEIISLSLLSRCVMRFRCDGRAGHDVVLDPRSALAMTGEARRDWTHEIPGSSVRDRRLSITFRTFEGLI
jgi:alkylated DNA repair dioxygenase AlkB